MITHAAPHNSCQNAAQCYCLHPSLIKTYKYDQRTTNIRMLHAVPSDISHVVFIPSGTQHIQTPWTHFSNQTLQLLKVPVMPCTNCSLSLLMRLPVTRRHKSSWTKWFIYEESHPHSGYTWNVRFEPTPPYWLYRPISPSSVQVTLQSPYKLPAELPKTEPSCSRHGAVAAWLPTERPGGVIPFSKTFIMLGVHSKLQAVRTFVKWIQNSAACTKHPMLPPCRFTHAPISYHRSMIVI